MRMVLSSSSAHYQLIITCIKKRCMKAFSEMRLSSCFRKRRRLKSSFGLRSRSPSVCVLAPPPRDASITTVSSGNR